MGMLDDAIREHFDLKRRHGADPDEVAREERAALAPLVYDDHDQQAQEPAEAPRDENDDVPLRHKPLAAHADADDLAKPGSTIEAEETAEIDMRAILGDDGLGKQAASPDGPGALTAASGESRETAEAEPTRFDGQLAASIEDGSLIWDDPAPRVRRLSRRPARNGDFDQELPAERSLP